MFSFSSVFTIPTTATTRVARCYSADLNDCPWCTIDPARLWIETEHAVALPDADGHTVVVPRRHVRTIYELTLLEQEAVCGRAS